MAMTIDLSLTGCVNRAPVTTTGNATLDGTTVEIDVTTRVVPLPWNPVLGVLGLRDAVWVLALVEAGKLEPLDVAFMSRKAQLRDEHTRDMGHEVMSLVARGSRVQGKQA